MKSIIIDAVEQSSLKLTKELYDTLYDLASYKHESRGFSFFIRKSYILGYISEVENDIKEVDGVPVVNETYYKNKKEEIELLQKLVNEMQGEILLIDNDNLIK